MNIKKLFSTAIVVNLCFSLSASAFDQYITVKFKNNVSEKYIQELNKMTATTVEKVISKNTYKLHIERVSNNDTLDKYSELFSLMKNVSSVSPVPRQKVADKINPNFYTNTSTNEKKATSTNSVEPTSETKDIPDEIIVKFNTDSPVEDVNALTSSLGGVATYQKDTGTYKIKIPDYVDYDYAKNFYENNPLVSGVSKSTITETKKAQTTNNSNSKYEKSTSGVSTSFSLLDSTEIKVTFKTGEEEIGYNWLNENFGAELVYKKGFSTYILRFPNNLSVKALSRSLKVCSSVLSSEIYYE